MTRPTDKKLESMGDWIAENASLKGIDLWNDLCAALDHDHSDWNAAIEAAAQKAETRFELCERDNPPPCYLRKCSIGRVLRALKKEPRHD